MAELKTFLFTDICGSVRLKNEMAGRSVTERDMAFIQTVLTPHRLRIDEGLKESGGRVVSTAGDGHFLVFDNTIQAAQWSIAVQEGHRDLPITTPGGEKVEVRISIHVGVPQVDPADPDNFVGKSVDYAARLNDYATGQQILVSRSVMAILDDVGLEGILLHLHGRRNLKGIGNVEVHELIYEPDGSPRPLRNEPKAPAEGRQWTVIPTHGFGEDETGGRAAIAVGPALSQVGNYRLEEQLGAGGMGDVYKARHTQFGRIRAVKVIKPQFVGHGHGEVVRRFYNEIKAVGKLEHRNIVVAIDSSSPADQVHYLVMEYIEGVGLDELVAVRGPLEVADACEVARQAARGLEYIFKHDMVHRDIKPSNLMLTLVHADQVYSDSPPDASQEEERGIVKILDLGLALLAEDGGDRVTRYDNKAMGTGMYMSPEQWRTTSVDIRADIYSLGCTLYHLLAGNPPYYDSDLRPEKAHEKEPPPPIRGGVQVTRRLWDVVRKMLAKRPQDRFATPAEVAAALEPFCEGHDLVALLRWYEQEGREASSLTRTRTDLPSEVDTWWSKVRSGASTVYPTRRWLLGTGLPLLTMTAALIGALFLVRNVRRDAALEAERRAKSNLASVARSAARISLASQISKRFAILSKAASDPLLKTQLEKINADPQDDALREPLLEWINQQFLDYYEQVTAESWFVTDRFGNQVARSPPSGSIGKNYAHRDYFHGQGAELDRTAANPSASDPPIIQAPNLSAVYRSTTTGKLKVAFSYPVWSEPKEDGQRRVLGVLAMSIDLGNFNVLERDLSGGNEILLIDTRYDSIEEQLKQGLILHHSDHKIDEGGKPLRVEQDDLKQMLERPADGAFLSRYRDPSADSEQSYWGAYEPVVFDVDGVAYRTGWTVLVQHSVPSY